jgi:hypothetical protein
MEERNLYSALICRQNEKEITPGALGDKCCRLFSWSESL